MPKPAEVQRLTTATHAEQVQVKLEQDNRPQGQSLRLDVSERGRLPSACTGRKRA
jgi:hypothetical protein